MSFINEFILIALLVYVLYHWNPCLIGCSKHEDMIGEFASIVKNAIGKLIASFHRG